MDEDENRDAKTSIFLPGNCRLRAHRLEEKGLRLFGYVEVKIVVTDESRDYGVVGLPHRWHAGRGAAQSRGATTTP
jgi:hypothetical protein